MAENDFLGKGWSFPPEFNKTEQSVKMLEGDNDIQSSLEILLSTRLGERVMQPKFGCALDDLMFESLTTTMSTYIKDLVETSILYHEPRIEVMKIDLAQTSTEGLIEISIDYKVRATNSRYNYVYPFYLNSNASK